MSANQNTVSSVAQNAIIRRASNRAQAGLRRLDQESAAKLGRVYQDAIDQLNSRIDLLADANGELQLEVLENLRNDITQSMRNLNTRQSDLFNQSLLESANLGASSFESVIESSGLVSAADEAARFVRGFVAADGLQLSDRFWRLNMSTKQIIEESLEGAIIMGWSSDRAAEEFIMRGEGVPAPLLNKSKSKSAARIKNNLRQTMTGKDRPLAQARRLFRTEMNRAHSKAYEAAAFEHPDVVGTKFLLSPNHPRPDICDMHANVNRYGLGKGVYPQGRNPLPAHPNTISFSVAVFNDDVTQDDQLSKMTRIQWLELQPPGMRAAVLGSQKKARALAAGQLKEREIASAWDQVKRRLTKSGVDAERFERGPLAPVPIVTNRPVSMAIATRVPSSALAHSLDAINFVHSDGRLPVINLNKVADVEGAPLGYFRPAVSQSKLSGLEIALSPSNTLPELTMTHEIGHFLDLDGIGDAGAYASVSSRLMGSWRAAVFKSQAVQALQSTAKNSKNEYVRHILNRYLLTEKELWARSYSQYIARASGDIVLNKQIKSRLAQGASTGLSDQWLDDDFDPIFDAIDSLFRDLGWRR